jgi:hypothetical protein
MHARYKLLPFVVLLSGLFLAFVALRPTSVLAQTPTTTIENGEGNTRFELNHNGSLLVPGVQITDGTENDSIPTEGAGTRLMWYPAKASFRAGNASSSSWDASNIGQFSVAMGEHTKASDRNTVAFGGNTEATSIGAVAMGRRSVASGLDAVAMGFDTQASGSYSVASGVGSQATNFYTAAIGNHTIAASDHSVSVGQCNSSNTSSDNTLFVVGNGPGNATGCDNRSDALRLESSGDMTIAGTLTESSDRRLKTDVEPLGEEVLRALQEIDPVRFRFKDERTHPAGKQIGLIAQEVQKEFPELVSKTEGGMLSLSYSKFSAVLLKGLQEQQARLEEKSDKIAELNAELEAVSNQQEKLKQRLATLETRTESSSILAGWSGSGVLAVLFALGLGIGAGLLWRGRVVVREAQSL